MEIKEIANKVESKLPVNGEIMSVAKGFAKDMASKLFLRTVTAAARIKNADRERLTTALKAGSVVLVGFMIASKLFGIQVILAILGGTIMLDDILKRVEDESDKAKIQAAFDALKSQESTEPVQ